MTNKSNREDQALTNQLIEAILLGDRPKIVSIFKSADADPGISGPEMLLLQVSARKGDVDSVLSLLHQGNHLVMGIDEELNLASINRTIKVVSLMHVVNTIKKSINDVVFGVEDGNIRISTTRADIYESVLGISQSRMANLLMIVGDNNHFKIDQVNKVDLSEHYYPKMKAMISEYLLSKAAQLPISLSVDVNDQAARRARI